MLKKVRTRVSYILIIRKYFGINEADIYIDVNMKFTYIFMIFYDRYYVTDDIADCNYNFFRNGSFCQGILCFNFSFDYIVLKYVMLLVYFFIKHCSFSWKIYTSFLECPAVYFGMNCWMMCTPPAYGCSCTQQWNCPVCHFVVGWISTPKSPKSTSMDQGNKKTFKVLIL